MLKIQPLPLSDAVGPRTSVLNHTTAEVFRQVCGLELVCDPHADWTCQQVIHATMDIAGDDNALLLVALPEEVAIGMARRLTGFEVPFDSRDMTHAMEDLMLILADHLRARLRHKGADITLSAPLVQHGDGEILPVPYRYLKKVTLASGLGPVLVAIIER